MTGIGRVVLAKHLCTGDRVLVFADLDGAMGPRRVGSVLFGDMYVPDGIWWKEQTEGTYAWSAPDIEVGPDELVLVFR